MHGTRNRNSRRPQPTPPPTHSHPPTPPRPRRPTLAHHPAMSGKLTPMTGNRGSDAHNFFNFFIFEKVERVFALK